MDQCLKNEHTESHSFPVNRCHFSPMFELVCGTSSAFLRDQELDQLGLLRHSESKNGRYQVRSAVSSEVFFDFCRKLAGHDVDVTSENRDSLMDLCEELQFTGFARDFEDLQDERLDLPGVSPVVCERLANMIQQADQADQYRDRMEEEFMAMSERIDSVNDAIDFLKTNELKAMSANIEELRSALNRGGMSNGPALQEVKIPYEASSDPFDGIIAHLLKNDVKPEVTSSPLVSKDGSADVILTAGGSSLLGQSQENAFFCIKFPGQRITPTHYSLMSHSIASYHHLKSWVIEVSGDGNEWKEIDRRENDEHLNGKSKSYTYQIQKKQQTAVPYIRLRQIGETHYGKGQKKLMLSCNCFEVFGVLYM